MPQIHKHKFMATVYGSLPVLAYWAPKNRQIYVKSADGSTRQVVRGITYDLKQWFAPHYKFDKATQGETKTMESKNFRLRAKNAVHGIRVGKKIDSQMSRVTRGLLINKISLSQFLGILACKQLVGVSAKNLGILQRMYKSLDTRVKMLLAAMDAAGLEPAGSEYPVVALAKKRGTKIDSVCRRRGTNQYVTINFKTHTKVHYDKSTPGKPLNGPFCMVVKNKKIRVSDSQRNQDCLQILAENLLFRSQLQLTSDKVESLILRVDADGVECIPIPEWAWAAKDYVWSRL